MVTMVTSSVVDHVFIGGVMVNMFTSSMVDHVFIGGVMVNMFASSVVDHVFIALHRSSVYSELFFVGLYSEPIISGFFQVFT